MPEPRDIKEIMENLENEKVKNLPPYLFAKLTASMKAARAKGEDVMDFSMGNPDGATPQHIVDKLIEAVMNPKNHRYSMSKGIYKLRLALTDWYKRRFNVDLDPETEAIATIGSKEGISHLMYAMINRGDSVIVPSPCYPIHASAVTLAGGNVISVNMVKDRDLLEDVEKIIENVWPKPKVLVLNYPHNPTTATVDLAFFERVVAFAKQHGIMILHDLAYAELYFDDYRPPSFLQVPGAKEVGAEYYTLSKTYNMPGWRVGFLAGNKKVIATLAKIKSYLDYGMFQPIQIAAIHALNSRDDCVKDIRAIYKSRRDVLVDGLNKLEWNVESPRASMFVWSPIPAFFKGMNSMEVSMKLLAEAHISVSPGIGFGEGGEGYLRWALIENEQRTKQALKNIKAMMEK